MSFVCTMFCTFHALINQNLITNAARNSLTDEKQCAQMFSIEHAKPDGRFHMIPLFTLCSRRVFSSQTAPRSVNVGENARSCGFGENVVGIIYSLFRVNIFMCVRMQIAYNSRMRVCVPSFRAHIIATMLSTTHAQRDRDRDIESIYIYAYYVWRNRVFEFVMLLLLLPLLHSLHKCALLQSDKLALHNYHFQLEQKRGGSEANFK